MYDKHTETETEMPPRKIWTERITLPLTRDTVAEIDAALEDDEYRLDLIREAIKRELQRRKRSKK